MTTSSPASSSNVAIDEKHGVQGEEVKPTMAGLNEQEREIIERQIEAPKLTVGYFALFRYATRNEFIIMVIAVIASIAAGAVMPLMTVCCPFLLCSIRLFEQIMLHLLQFCSPEIYQRSHPWHRNFNLLGMTDFSQ
jgi:hypothetical protein